MKAQPMSKGVRLTATASEASAILTLCNGGTVSGEMADAIRAALRPAIAAMNSQRLNKSSARAAARDQVRQRDAHRDNRTVDGCTVTSTRGDWIDVSRNPDLSDWRNLTQGEVFASLNLPGGIPADQQGEIRRDVWHVMVLNPVYRTDDCQPMFLGSDCTETAERRDIEAVARRIIEAAA